MNPACIQASDSPDDMTEDSWRADGIKNPASSHGQMFSNGQNPAEGQIKWASDSTEALVEV